MKIIGYAEFVEMCQVDAPRNWHGMEVRADGVWVQLPPDDVLLFPSERAVLSAHPTRDLTTPALKFPCTYKQLRTFLEWAEVGMAKRYLGIEVSEVANDSRKGGRPKGPLYEAVEYAYKKFLDAGNIEILRPGKVIEFLDRLKELADEENRDLCDYVAERIEIVKKRGGSLAITAKERVVEEGKVHVTKYKSVDYSKKDVSKVMSALREKYPLSI